MKKGKEGEGEEGGRERGKMGERGKGRGGERRKKLEETLKLPLSLQLEEWLPKSFFLRHPCG